jgi:hypothetical protein
MFPTFSAAIRGQQSTMRALLVLAPLDDSQLIRFVWIRRSPRSLLTPFILKPAATKTHELH